LSQEFWMMHRERPAVSQINIKRLEGSSLMHLTELLDCHAM